MPFYQGYAPGMPGIGQTSYSRGRMIWAGLSGIQYLPVGGIIASALARDPDNWAGSGNYGNETEPETPPTTTGLSNIPQLPGAIDGAAPTSGAPGYSGVLRAGLLMGRITSTPTVALCGTTSAAIKGYFRPSILGLTLTTTANNASTISVSASCYYEIVRQYALGVTTFTITGAQSGTATTLYNGTFVASGTNSITGTTGSIGVTSWSTSPTGTLAIGAVIGPADGSQYPVSFVDEQFGLNVVDNFGNSLYVGNSSGNTSLNAAPFPRVPLAGGMVNVLNLINYPLTPATGSATQTALQVFIKSNLNSGGGVGVVAAPVNYGGKFNFTDDYGL